MRPIASFTLHAMLAAVIAAVAATSAAATDHLKLLATVNTGVADRGGKDKWIEIQGWDWGARRKGWDGTVKGGSVSAEKYGAVSGMHRDADIKSPHDAASGMPAGKRQHDWQPSPNAVDGGSVRVKVKFPWVGCTVGDRVPAATLDAGGKSYDLTDLTVSACATDEVILDYAKVKVRGWDPEKKEE